MNDDLVERPEETLRAICEGAHRPKYVHGGFGPHDPLLPWPCDLEIAALELTRLRKENEELRGERDVLRKSWNACRQLALDAITESGEVPLVDGRDLSSALGFAWYAEPTEGGTPSSKSTNDMRPSAGAGAQEER